MFYTVLYGKSYFDAYQILSSIYSYFHVYVLKQPSFNNFSVYFFLRTVQECGLKKFKIHVHVHGNYKYLTEAI